MKKDAPIGFFDSGVGGISVLKKTLEVLPNENYIYFGDSANAPYGTKSEKEIIDLSINAVNFLLEKNVKAIVIACNTATSVAANILREKYPDTPILGIEPAVNPALKKQKNGFTLVMATPVTLSKGKFIEKLKKYENNYKIKSIPCPGLAEIVESGNIKGPIIEEYLQDILKDVVNIEIDNIVLGCTHYPFIKESLLKLLNTNVEIIDGSLGTAVNLKQKLEHMNLQTDRKQLGKVEIFNSSKNEKMYKLSHELLKFNID